MSRTEIAMVTFEIREGDNVQTISVDQMPVVPAVGDDVELNYVHGEKAQFRVTGVKHFISSIGEGLLQQITVTGTKL
jgi:hypothetical protein